MNKTFLIISVVLTILSVIYMLLDYFGVIRYISIHFKSPEKYSTVYSSLDKGHKNRVIISLHADNKNINKLKPIISSLIDQSVRVDEIALNVDHSTIVPDYLKNYVAIHRSYNANKLTPTIIREKDTDTLIIALDSDTIYGSDFIADILDAFEDGKVIYAGKKNGIYKGPILIKTGYFDAAFLDLKGDINNILTHYLSSLPHKKIKTRENFKNIF
jgi:hypothetical protein